MVGGREFVDRIGLSCLRQNAMQFKPGKHVSNDCSVFAIAGVVTKRPESHKRNVARHLHWGGL